MDAQARGMARTADDHALLDWQKKLAPLRIELSCLAMEAHNREEGRQYASALGLCIGLAVKAFMDNANDPMSIDRFIAAVEMVQDSEKGPGKIMRNVGVTATTGGRA